MPFPCCRVSTESQAFFCQHIPTSGQSRPGWLAVVSAGVRQITTISVLVCHTSATRSLPMAWARLRPPSQHHTSTLYLSSLAMTDPLIHVMSVLSSGRIAISIPCRAFLRAGQQLSRCIFLLPWEFKSVRYRQGKGFIVESTPGGLSSTYTQPIADYC